jgi:hypothetical protein
MYPESLALLMSLKTLRECWKKKVWKKKGWRVGEFG